VGQRGKKMKFISVVLSFLFYLSLAHAADFRVVVKFGDKIRTYELKSSGSKNIISEAQEGAPGRHLDINEKNAKFLNQSIAKVFQQKSHEISLCPAQYIWIQNLKTEHSRIACVLSNTEMTDRAVRVANSFSTAFQFL
jgi:hypothetical protein